MRINTSDVAIIHRRRVKYLVHKYMYIHIHTHNIHTYIHTYIVYTYTYTYIHIHIHTHIHNHTHYNSILMDSNSNSSNNGLHCVNVFAAERESAGVVGIATQEGDAPTTTVAVDTLVEVTITVVVGTTPLAELATSSLRSAVGDYKRNYDKL